MSHESRLIDRAVTDPLGLHVIGVAGPPKSGRQPHFTYEPLLRHRNISFFSSYPTPSVLLHLLAYKGLPNASFQRHSATALRILIYTNNYQLRTVTYVDTHSSDLAQALSDIARL